MKHFVYAIFDRASGVYDRPFPAISDKAAERSFGDLVADSNTTVGRHPDDFTLFRIGSYNDNNGKLEGEVPEKIANGAELYARGEVIEPSFGGTA